MTELKIFPRWFTLGLALRLDETTRRHGPAALVNTKHRMTTLTTTSVADSELRQKLRWLNRYRILFTLVLLGSTLFFHLGKPGGALNVPLALLYGTIATLLILSFFYSIALPKI